MSHELLTGVRVGPPAHGGHCVARVEGRVVFVRHSAPGELVDVRLTESGSSKRFWRGDAVTVHEPSPDRRPHVWAQAGPGGVGGGELGHLTLRAQRRWKSDVITDVLRRIGHLDLSGTDAGPVEVEALPGDDSADGLGTRTRVAVVVDPEGNAGMYRHRSHDIEALDSMPLAAPAIEELDPFAPRRWSGLPAGHRIALVAPSAGEALVLDGSGRVPVAERVRVGEQVFDYRVDADGFWQVHRQAPSALIEAVLEGLAPQPGERIADLYSGAGLFALPVAAAVTRTGAVYAVEADSEAADHARRNLREYPHVEQRAARVEARNVSAFLPDSLDAVVLDPPRSGAGQDVIAAIAARGPRRICYVACDPAALARDLRALLDTGYALRSLRGLDLFPHTHHVEAVAVVDREP